MNLFLQYLQHGHPLGYDGPTSSRWSENLLSIQHDPLTAAQKIHKEVTKGRIAGPFDSISDTGNPSLIISPIGLVPKSTGGFRLIHHLSHPWGGGINAYIDDDICKVSYGKFDDATRILTKFGRHATMAKLDVESAYRLLSMRTADFRFLGFQFRGKVFYDKMAPMGAKISASHWERFGALWDWLVNDIPGFTGATVRYLDDLLVIFPGHHSDPHQSFSHIKALCADIGLPLAEAKLIPPAPEVQFLGLTLDARTQTISIPQEKLEKAQHHISATLRKRLGKVRKCLYDGFGTY